MKQEQESRGFLRARIELLERENERLQQENSEIRKDMSAFVQRVSEFVEGMLERREQREKLQQEKERLESENERKEAELETLQQENGEALNLLSTPLSEFAGKPADLRTSMCRLFFAMGKGSRFFGSEGLTWDEVSDELMRKFKIQKAEAWRIIGLGLRHRPEVFSLRLHMDREAFWDSEDADEEARNQWIEGEVR